MPRRAPPPKEVEEDDAMSSTGSAESLKPTISKRKRKASVLVVKSSVSEHEDFADLDFGQFLPPKPTKAPATPQVKLEAAETTIPVLPPAEGQPPSSALTERDGIIFIEQISADVEMGGPAAEPQPRPAPSPVPSPATKPAENDPTNAPFDKLAAAVNAETETVQQFHAEYLASSIERHIVKEFPDLSDVEYEAKYLQCAEKMAQRMSLRMQQLVGSAQNVQSRIRTIVAQGETRGKNRESVV